VTRTNAACRGAAGSATEPAIPGDVTSSAIEGAR
jgi:hypothetical protein